ELAVDLENAVGELLVLGVGLGTPHAERGPLILEADEGVEQILNGAVGDQRREGRELSIGRRIRSTARAVLDDRQHPGERVTLGADRVDAGADLADALDLARGLFLRRD